MTMYTGGYFFPGHSVDSKIVFTGRMPRSGKLLVLNLLTGQKSGFSPRRGESLHWFKSNLARPTGTWVRWLCKISPQSPKGVGIRPQKYQKFQLFGKESPRRGDSLDWFRKFLRAFICL